MSHLGELFWTMLMLSLVAFGGGKAVLGQMRRDAVSLGWMSNDQFTAVYALSQVMPGPGMLIVALIGYKVASWAGVVVAMVAMFAPAAIFATLVRLGWGHFKSAKWRDPLQAALGSVTVGVLFASNLIVARGAVHEGPAVGWVLVVGGAALSVTKLNPLWLMAGGAVLGVSGLV